ncbi:MAG: calcium-binding protein, partial [Desulfobacterales bacterium]
MHEYQGRGPLNEGDKQKVFGIELFDDHYGIIVACRKGRKRYDFPLVDLKVTEKKSINSDIIEAYRTWFANRHFGLLIVISV